MQRLRQQEWSVSVVYLDPRLVRFDEALKGPRHGSGNSRWCELIRLLLPAGGRFSSGFRDAALLVGLFVAIARFCYVFLSALASRSFLFALATFSVFITVIVIVIVIFIAVGLVLISETILYKQRENFVSDRTSYSAKQ